MKLAEHARGTAALSPRILWISSFGMMQFRGNRSCSEVWVHEFSGLPPPCLHKIYRQLVRMSAHSTMHSVRRPPRRDFALTITSSSVSARCPLYGAGGAGDCICRAKANGEARGHPYLLRGVWVTGLHRAAVVMIPLGA